MQKRVTIIVEEGQPIKILRKGDAVQVSPGTVHWHGAAPDSWFAHIAIGTNPGAGGVEWLNERISEEEYNNLPQP